MPALARSPGSWCATEPHDCSGLLRNGGAPCPRLDGCPQSDVVPEEDLDRRRLQPGQPLLLIYWDELGTREVFGEVRLPLKHFDLVRLYLEDGRTDAILLRFAARHWRDLTNGARVGVVEELTGPQLSRFMLYRDYAHSACAPRRQPSLKGLRASA